MALFMKENVENDQFDGEGKLIWPDGDFYEGETDFDDIVKQIITY